MFFRPFFLVALSLVLSYGTLTSTIANAETSVIYKKGYVDGPYGQSPLPLGTDRPDGTASDKTPVGLVPPEP